MAAAPTGAPRRRGDGRAPVAAAGVHEAVAGHVKVGPVLAARHHVVLLRLRLCCSRHESSCTAQMLDSLRPKSRGLMSPGAHAFGASLSFGTPKPEELSCLCL